MISSHWSVFTSESILTLALDMIPSNNYLKRLLTAKNYLERLLRAKCPEPVQITDAPGKTHLAATFVIDLSSLGTNGDLQL